MDNSFHRSIFYSGLFHVLLLLMIFLVFRHFLLVRTPLLMELTLIGEMSKGEGLGSSAAHPGVEVGQAPQAETNGEFSTPKQETANPPVTSLPKPEVSLRKPLKSRKNPGTSSSEAYLRSLRRTAPIGLSPKKDDLSEIKTTVGLGHTGEAGTPDGSPQIEGELAARAIKKQVKPDYPDWAKKQGIEAVIKFRLTVLPNGLLKLDELQPEQTSGYRELDRVVYDALIQWEFEPLAAQIPQVNQTGVITFSFSLSNSPAP